jgi:hypothetical protein
MKDGETFKHKGHTPALAGGAREGNEGKPTNANQFPLYPLCPFVFRLLMTKFESIEESTAKTFSKHEGHTPALAGGAREGNKGNSRTL